ncbi:MAG: hypothetical protein CBC42_03225 [Betaproteobacteria bacterium TMED82]|nr:MAG: hypothetical protein CBC42_03225 [Betaproteobacteria bacterium TMED82]
MKIVCLLLAIVFSALSLVQSRHNERVISAETQRILREHHQIQIQLANYELILSKLRDRERISVIARNSLGMSEIDVDKIIYFNQRKEDKKSHESQR